MKRIILPEFQEYLRSKSLVNEKYIPFYALWSSKFLAFSESNGHLSPDLQIQKFLNNLKAQKDIADWQVRQADEAVQIYVNQFPADNKSPSFSSPPEVIEKPSALSGILGNMREALRIKHYAYRTEVAYLDWVGRFYNYTVHVKKKDLHSALDSVDVRDYLSYLALKQKVAASTQNQALL